MIGTAMSLELRIWPSGSARFADGILEVTTGDGIRVAAPTSWRSVSSRCGRAGCRSPSSIGSGSTGSRRALGRARARGGASTARRRRHQVETTSVMWVEVVIEAVGLLWPFGRRKPVEPGVVEPGASTVRVEVGHPRAYVRGLNANGSLAEEVLAAGLLRQGEPYSLLGLVTCVALLDWLRTRRAKTLPREFVLAVTAQRVIAFAVSAVAEDGGDGSVEAVWITRGECGSWPRHRVRVIDRTNGFQSKGATLELGGVERVPVAWDDDGTDELIEHLNR
jgi:hypothetical protein